MVKKKNNKIPKIKGRKKIIKEVLLNQKTFDKDVEWLVEYRKGLTRGIGRGRERGD